VAQLAAHFKVPGMVCVNKFDLNPDQTDAIEKLAKENNMTVVGRVPFDRVFTESMVKGQTVLEYEGNSKIRSSISEIWLNIRNQLVL
jgi:MinD superfamily P-loop ATPase